MWKIGDKIICSNISRSKNIAAAFCWLGIIINVNQDETYHLICFDDLSNTFIKYYVDAELIKPISEADVERRNISETYERLINEEKIKLRTTLHEEDKETDENYKKIKRQIIYNCRKIIDECRSEKDFIGHITTIVALYNQISSQKMLQYLQRIFKYDNEISHAIQNLQDRRDAMLDSISDKRIQICFQKF